MKIEVSNGEILDKVSILKIKLEKIFDDNKRRNIETELNMLNPIYDTIVNNFNIKQKFIELMIVNRKLWNIEDAIRQKEIKKEFDNEFIKLARSVYMENDLRFKIKKEINILSDSILVEEKSYEKK